MIAPRRLLIGLACANAIMALLLVYALAAPISDPDPPLVTLNMHSDRAEAALSVVIPPADAFAEISKRPLFSLARTAIASADGAQAALPPDIQLVGIIADNEQRMALIRMAGEPLAKALRLGAMVSGWKVADIQSDRMVLEGAGGRIEFRLDANKIAKPSAGTPGTSSQ